MDKPRRVKLAKDLKRDGIAVPAYQDLWHFLDKLIREDRATLTDDEAEWFYCDQPGALWGSGSPPEKK